MLRNGLLSIAKFQVINVKNISTIKTENILIIFIDSTIYFILYEMRNSLKQQYLTEIATDKMFRHNYDDISSCIVSSTLC